MSDDTSDDLGGFFALPPFKPDEALVQLRRQLRELKLQELPGGPPHRFALAGQRGVVVAELQATQAGDARPAIAASAVKRPLQRPEWVHQQLGSRDAVRKWLDAFKRQLASWTDED